MIVRNREDGAIEIDMDFGSPEENVHLILTKTDAWDLCAVLTVFLDQPDGLKLPATNSQDGSAYLVK